MSKDKYIDDLKEIRAIMSRTTRFISLSGLSGVSTGITALGGALLAYMAVFKNNNYLVYDAVNPDIDTLSYLLIIALSTLVFSIVTAIFFTRRKTKSQNKPCWHNQTKHLIINLLIPLTTGGILCLMLLLKGFVGILPSLTLIFYGLALINASKYTLPEIRNLGFLEIILGLLAFHLISYSVIIWAIGFGVVQIIYGLIIQRKY